MPYARRVVDAWPVETGLSRAAFRVRPRRTRTKLRLRLQNDVFYSAFLAEAVRKLFAEADPMADDVAKQIVRGVS